MDSKATARPWKVYHESGSMGSGGHWGIESASSDPLFQRTLAVMSQNSHLSGAEACANASLIVQAVNERDAMVGLLQKCADRLDIEAENYRDATNGPGYVEYQPNGKRLGKLADECRALLARLGDE